MIECLGVRGTFRTLVGINYILTTVVSKLFRGGKSSFKVLMRWGISLDMFIFSIWGNVQKELNRGLGERTHT